MDTLYVYGYSFFFFFSSLRKFHENSKRSKTRFIKALLFLAVVKYRNEKVAGVTMKRGETRLYACQLSAVRMKQL